MSLLLTNFKYHYKLFIIMTEISREKINLALKNSFKELINDGMVGYEFIELDEEFFALRITDPRYIWLTNIYLSEIKVNGQHFSRPYSNLFIRQLEQKHSIFYNEKKKIVMPSTIQKSFLDYINDENLKDYFKEQFIVICSPIDYSSKYGNPSKSTISRKTSEIRNRIHKLFEEKGLNKDRLSILFTGLSSQRSVIDEDIGTFITCHFLKNKGYFVGCPPIWSVPGDPDAYAFKSNITEKLKEMGFVENGAFIEELATLRIFEKVKGSLCNHPTSPSNSETIVIEVEPTPDAQGKENGYGQLRLKSGNYLSIGNFDRGLWAAPFLKRDLKRDVNILTFDQNGLAYTECKEVFSNNEAKTKLLKEFEDIVKLLLLQNLYFDEILELIDVKSLTTYQLINKISKIEFDKILDVLEQKIKH